MKQDDMFLIYVYPCIPLEQMHVFVHLLHQCYIQYTVTRYYTYLTIPNYQGLCQLHAALICGMI
jgi:hypothetical protein